MVFQVNNYPFNLKIGLIISSDTANQFNENLITIINLSYDFMVTSILNNNKLIEQNNIFNLDHCYITSDLSYGNKIKQVCALINIMLIQKKQILAKIIGYCIYLGMNCITIEYYPQHSDKLLEYLNENQFQLHQSHLTIILYIKDIKCKQNFIQFMNLLHNNINVHLMLELDNDCTKEQLSWWFSYKIQFIVCSDKQFIFNHKGYPVLKNSFENIIVQLFKINCQFVLKIDKISHLNQQFLQYICFLYKNMVKNSTKRQIQSRRMIDVLLNPLQPYFNNLSSQTYEVFQFDIPKYDEYQLAIRNALSKLNKKTVVILYVGAGRGGLLPAIMSASKSTNCKVITYAIEKNPYPIQTMKAKIRINKWSSFVKVVQTDIKDYKMAEQPDILLSELLGGFGDNQLSPQCLNWAEKFINTFTLCIPTSYSSYIKPVSCNSIHRSIPDNQKQNYYTVNIHACYTPFNSQQAWIFSHPLPQNQNFERQNKLCFKMQQKIEIDGFIGSFKSTLFGNSEISILPELPSIDMYSWYPIYFSFKQSEIINKDEIIEISIRRKVTKQKVWYEWQYNIFNKNLQKRKQSKIHNKNGQNNSILL